MVYRVQSVRVQGFGFMGFRAQVRGIGFRVQGLGFRD